jgi:alkanesulfonate monooxygenase SsuD/methylene tetrahydromethanopterin reductase-like flavin-dependent oxidoreductase (luciferase family)
LPRIEFGLAFDFMTERAGLDRVLEEYESLLQPAEQLGFSSIWAGESYPTAPGSYHLPSPFLALASLARRTSLKIGTGVILLPAWHPLRLAYDAAVLDQIAGGRLILGVGAGSPKLWARFGADRASLAEWLDDMLGALRALWTGAPGFSGSRIRVQDGILPRPSQPNGPPIWVGGRVPRAARRAANFGDGWYASTQYRLEEIRAQASRYRQSLGPDRGTGLVAVNRVAFVAEDSEQAWQQATPYVTSLLRKYVAMGALSDADELLGPSGEQPEVLRRLARDICLIGSPQDVVAELGRYAEAGVTHVQLRVAPSDMPLDLARRTVDLVGQRVLPAF